MATLAEQIVESMVDESGYCGERGLSKKQFWAMARHLEAGKTRDAGGWDGDYAGRSFTTEDYEGNIGKWHVKLNIFHHFHDAHSVVSIEPLPAEEVERMERVKALRESFASSEWVGQPKERMELELTLVGKYDFYVESYSGYGGYESRIIYTLADADGNCFVWKTGSYLSITTEKEDGSVKETFAKVGDLVKMKATVKAHGEYKGTKQTVLTRPKVAEIA